MSNSSRTRDASPTVAACLTDGAYINKCAGNGEERPARACRPFVYLRSSRSVIRTSGGSEYATSNSARRIATVSTTIFLATGGRGRGDALANFLPGVPVSRRRSLPSVEVLSRMYICMHRHESRDQRRQRRIAERRISFYKQNTDGRGDDGWRSEPHQLQSAASSDSRSWTAARVRRPRLAAGTAVICAGAVTTNFQFSQLFVSISTNVELLILIAV